MELMRHMKAEYGITRRLVTGILLLCSLTLLSCAPQPDYREVQLLEVPDAQVSTEIFFYPLKGQTAEQQDRDRYECYLWAVEKSGFDPSAEPLAPHQQVVVKPAPSEGQNTLVGVVAGAILGGVIGDSSKGAVLGAMAGGLLGAAADTAQNQQATAADRQYHQLARQRSATLERRAGDYRRAMQACLEGRGYSVK